MSSIDCILPESVGRLSAIFAGGGRISILAHTHPDGDALGSTGALVSYLKEKRGADALAIFSDAAPASLSFLCNSGDFIFADSDPQAALQRISHSDVIILLDCNGFSRTEQLNGPLCESKAVKVLIDHHIDPERDFFDLVFSTEDISSTCELLFYILLEMDDIKGDARKLPSACARSLMAGMTTDTNNFANSVYPSTLRMASALLEAGVDRDSLLDELYHRYRENRVRVMGYLQNEGMNITDKGVAYIIADKAVLERFDVKEGETESLVNVPLAIKKVRMSIFLKEENGLFRVSIRSRKGVSAQKLAVKYFHGGGHENAAGGKLFYPGDIPSPADAGAFLERITNEYFG